jgi:sugar phosphate isomerase/epimerase
MTILRRIFVSTACIKEAEPLMARLSSYRNAGLDAIELGMCVHVDQGDLSGLAVMDTQFLVHNYFPPPGEPFIINLASADPGIRQRSLDLAKHAIILTRELNAPFYAIHAGFVTDPCGFGDPYFLFPELTVTDVRKKAFERYINALSIINQYAIEHEVGLLIENNVCAPEMRGQVLLDRPDEFSELFEKINSSNSGILLDFGHLNVAAHTLGFDRLDFIKQLTPYIRSFHVHDNDGTFDTHSPVQPGSWVLEVLRRPEFADLPLVVEAKFDDVTSLSQHVDWLRGELSVIMDKDKNADKSENPQRG